MHSSVESTFQYNAAVQLTNGVLFGPKGGGCGLVSLVCLFTRGKQRPGQGEPIRGISRTYSGNSSGNGMEQCVRQRSG